MDVRQNLTTLEFAEKNAFFYDTTKFEFGKIKLHDYQKNMLNEIDNNRFVLVRHPRQMGVTTMLILYITNYLLSENDEPTTTFFISNNMANSCEVLKKVKLLLLQIDPSMEFDIDRKNCIQLKNKNILLAIGSSSFKDYSVDNIVIDNANYIKNLDLLYSAFVPAMKKNGKLIMASGNKSGSTFFKKLFTKEDNNFIKIKLNWLDNPKKSEKWYDDQLRVLGDKTLLDIELDLIEGEDEKEKTIVSFRIEQELLNKIKDKIFNQDIILSDYLRNLIQKDLG